MEVDSALMERAIQLLEEGTQPTIRQEIAKPIPATKQARKPKNSTKHHKNDRNGLKLTEPCLSDHTADSATQHIHRSREYGIFLFKHVNF